MSISEAQFLLAIGYQKTGTTWLDRHLWSNPDAGFFNVKGSSLRKILIGTRPLEFDVDECRRRLQECMPALPDEKVPVIGRERLSGSPHAGGYDSKEIAERLHKLFPRSKVLIIIREQRQMILSTYHQSVIGGNSMTLKEYLDDPEPFRYHIPHFELARFRYHHLIKHYIDLFGPKGVLVLPYEMFRSHPSSYVEQIVRFAGGAYHEEIHASLPFSKRERAALTPFSSQILRLFNAFVGERNQFTPHPAFPLRLNRQRMERRLRRLENVLPRWFVSRNMKNRQKQMDHVSQLAAGVFEESNSAITKLTGLDLGAFGYALPHQGDSQ